MAVRERRTSRAGRALAVAVLATALLSGSAATTADAAVKPDLQVTALSVARSTVAQGSTVKISDTTKNRSGGVAGASVTRYYLSKDGIRNAGDVLLASRAVGRLSATTTAKGSKVVIIPVATRPRVYRVLGCADATSKVRESSETNNCRSVTLSVTAADPGVFPQTPDPLNVTYTVDSARTTTARVYDFRGATLTTTGADGTGYRLEIPANALSDDTKITITPVLTIEGLPMTRSAGAVEITPHGLLLNTPATLTITPADAPVLAEQTGFLFHDGGADFQMMPLEPGAPIAMKLTHFSTPGIGAATPRERATIADRSPARTVAQFQNEVSTLLGAERRAQLTTGTGDPDLYTKITKLSNEYFDEVVEPKLKAAETDDRLALEAIARGLSYLRQVALFGLDDGGRGDGLFAQFSRILRNAIEKSYLRCVDKNSVREALNLMVYARANTLLGSVYQDQEIYDYQRRCARFEVRFESRIAKDQRYNNGSEAYDMRALYDVGAGPFVVSLETPNTSTGSGAVSWDAFEYSSTRDYADPRRTDITETGSDPRPGTVFVTVRMGSNYYLPNPGQAPDQAPPGIDGELDLAFQDNGVITAPSEGYTSSTGGSRRATQWMHEVSSNHNQGSYEVVVPIRGLEQNGAQLLQKVWHFAPTADPYGTLVEDSSLVLTHVPCQPTAACP